MVLVEADDDAPTVHRIRLISEIRDWIATKLVSLGGDYIYHEQCISQTKIGIFYILENNISY